MPGIRHDQHPQAALRTTLGLLDPWTQRRQNPARSVRLDRYSSGELQGNMLATLQTDHSHILAAPNSTLPRSGSTTDEVTANLYTRSLRCIAQACTLWRYVVSTTGTRQSAPRLTCERSTFAVQHALPDRYLGRCQRYDRVLVARGTFWVARPPRVDLESANWTVRVQEGAPRPS